MCFLRETLKSLISEEFMASSLHISLKGTSKLYPMVNLKLPRKNITGGGGTVKKAQWACILKTTATLQ